MSTQSQQARQNEKGSALWFILVAVVLIGLLTVVLSRSGSSVNQTADVEQASIKISQLMRYAQGLAAAVQQMTMSGISESDVSFENAGANVNANCAGSNACKIFHVEGAGQGYTAPPSGLGTTADWLITAANDVEGVGEAGQADLVLMLTGIDPEICTLINRQAGQTYAADGDVDFTPFAGSYTMAETIDGAGGKTTGCLAYDNAGTEEPFFYYVLLAR